MPGSKHTITLSGEKRQVCRDSSDGFMRIVKEEFQASGFSEKKSAAMADLLFLTIEKFEEESSCSRKYADEMGIPRKSAKEMCEFIEGRKDKKKTKESAEEFADEVGGPPRETEHFFRDRQISPSECQEGSYRTIERGGKKLVLCKKKGSEKMTVQSIMTPK